MQSSYLSSCRGNSATQSKVSGKAGDVVPRGSKPGNSIIGRRATEVLRACALSAGQGKAQALKTSVASCR